MLNKSIPLSPVLMAAQDAAAGHAAPEWVHLLPGSATGITTADARGPYHVTNAETLIAASFADMERLPVDENHATDLAAPQGLPAPARGWIVEMQARADGIWGRVEWTEAGRALVGDRAYRAISPVILHDAAKTITRILRASLVNRPNLRGLAALHSQESTMTLMERLAELLGLDATTTDDQVVEAISALKGTTTAAPDVALQSALAEIGTALGVQGDATAVVAAAKAVKIAAAGSEAIPALQSEIAALTIRLNSVTEGQARTRAEDFVERAIKQGRSGVKSLRDHYVAMHMADPARVEKEIGAQPILGPSNTLSTPPAARDGTVALNAAQVEAARHLGIPQKDYIAQLTAERANEETL